MTAPLRPFGEADFYKTDLPAILRPYRPAPARSLFAALLVLVIGTLIGIVSAYLVVERERPFQALRIGPWEAYPKAGTATADPYSVAIYTRGAIVPLATGEGLALVALTDSAGRTLNPACSYQIRGLTPTARLWTLTATDRHGKLWQTLPGRGHIASRGLLRQEDGSFTITASATPQPGNWLPLAAYPEAADGMRLTLRLYDAPVTTGAALDGAIMPAITQVSCP